MMIPEEFTMQFPAIRRIRCQGSNVFENRADLYS